MRRRMPWPRLKDSFRVHGERLRLHLCINPNATPRPSDMNSYHNLDSSLFRHDASSTPQSNMLQEYQRQASQEITQTYNEFHRPPGAESMGTLSPPTQPGPARLSLQESLPLGHTELGEHANSRILSPFMNVQADESNNVIFSTSPSRSISLSPSHAYPSRAPVHGLGNPPASQLSSYSSSNSTRSHPYSHLRALSQPSPMPTTVLTTGSGHPHYSGAHQMAAPPSKLPSAMQRAPLPTPIGTNIPLLPLSSPRRHSENDRQDAQNDHDLVTFFTDPTQTVFPGFPPPSSSQRFSPGFTDPLSGTSSQTHSGGSSRMDDSFPFSSSPISTDGSLGPRPSSSSSTITHGATVLFQTPSHLPTLHPRATTSATTTLSSSSSSPSSQDRPPERQRRSVRSRRPEPPRDQRATDRLSGQRKSDDENTDALYKLFVPPGAEVKWKKDRLGIILHYATRLVDRYNSLVEYYERNRDVRDERLAQSDEGLHQTQEQLFGRHGDFSREVGHWVATNDSLDHTLTNVEHGLHQQQRHSPMDDQHDIARP